MHLTKIHAHHEISQITKHIRVKTHFIKDGSESKELVIQEMDALENVGNMMTKVLATGSKVQVLLDLLNIG